LHSFLEVGKTQDLPSKFWQTLGDGDEFCQVGFVKPLENIFFLVLPKLDEFLSNC
jgi:hypothetical protein